MTFLLKALELLAAGVWIGAIVFFSFFAAPAVFKALPKETAGEVISAILSRYYLLTATAGTVCVASAVCLGLRAGGRNFLDLAKTVLLMVMLAMTLYAGTVVHQRIRAVKAEIKARPPVEVLARLEADFALWHRRSVMLNGATLACGLVVVLILSSRLSS